MLVKLDYFPRSGQKKNTYLKPPIIALLGVGLRFSVVFSLTEKKHTIFLLNSLHDNLQQSRISHQRKASVTDLALRFLGTSKMHLIMVYQYIYCYHLISM